jgi:hypothetical protein
VQRYTFSFTPAIHIYGDLTAQKIPKSIKISKNTPEIKKSSEKIW